MLQFRAEFRKNVQPEFNSNTSSKYRAVLWISVRFQFLRAGRQMNVLLPSSEVLIYDQKNFDYTGLKITGINLWLLLEEDEKIQNIHNINTKSELVSILA